MAGTLVGVDGFTGLIIGSVSQQCVQRAACLVLVVFDGAERRG